MIRLVWIAAYAAIGLTILFLFLGAVAYQSGESMSVAHQQSVLNSFGSVMRADLYGVADQNAFLRGHKIVESPEIAAFIMDDNNAITATSWSGDMPFGIEEVVAKLTSDADLKSYQQQIEVADARLVWLNVPLQQEGHRLVLVHQCVAVGFGELTELYVLPIAIAALLVIWATFWASMSARKMIRSQARQAQLEIDLLRHEEADKIRVSFLANMSHELRTPLNAIIGFSEMLKMRAFGPLGHERNGEYVESIHAAGEQMLKLVSNLLDLSQIESGGEELEEEVVATADVIDTIRLMVQGACAERGIELHLSPDVEMPELRVDPVKVKQIMLQLCRNAIVHTPEGGRIELNVRLKKDDRMVLEVKDTGGGIESDVLKSLVANFGHAQSDAVIAKSGAGIGLPLCDALMKLHGGELRIMSVVGEGTTVSAIFPAHRIVRTEHRPSLQATG